MADLRATKRASTASRSEKAAGGITLKSRPSTQQTKTKAKVVLDLKAKEEEYRRLNEELEAKSASLMKEADDFLMRDPSSLLQKSGPSLVEQSSSGTMSAPGPSATSVPPKRSAGKQKTTSGKGAGSSQKVQQGGGVTISAKERLRTTGGTQKKLQSQSFTRPATGGTTDHSQREEENPSDDKLIGQLLEQKLKLQEMENISSHSGFDSFNFDTGTGQSAEKGTQGVQLVSDPQFSKPKMGMETLAFSTLDGGQLQGDPPEDDIIPDVAEDLGPDAMIRFLKAKLRVMQEEMDKLHAENSSKHSNLTEAQTTIATLSNENAKLKKTQQALQVQIDKYKQLTDEMKAKCSSLEGHLSSLRKDLDARDRHQKQLLSNQSATDVRLNRALEELERAKSALQREKSEKKESLEQDKKVMEKVTTENKHLEKQRNDLMAAFKKQLKLIDVLKKQKMHLEASKLLSFTEEEFVKALDWDKL